MPDINLNESTGPTATPGGEAVIDRSDLTAQFVAALSDETTPDEPDTEEEPEPTEETDEPEDDGDPDVDVPGLGKLKASDIKSLHDSRDKLSNVEETLREKMEAAKLEEGALEHARTLSDLLHIPEFRSKVQTIIDEMMATGEKTSAPDGKTIDLSKFRDSRLDDMKDDIASMKEMVRERQIQEHWSRLDGMKASFVEKFGGEVFTDDTWNGIIEGQLKERGNELDYKDIELAAMRLAMEKGVPAATRRAAAEVAASAARKGSRIVIAPKHQTTTEAPKTVEYKGPLSRRELASVFEKNL